MYSKCRKLGLEPIISDEVALLAPLPAFWDAFRNAPEYSDGEANPLDRYSKRVITPLAERLDSEAVFPSDGPPYPPFISWALSAEGVYLSPIGLLVHDQFGLFISFRGALKIPNQTKRQTQNPCQDCSKPCIQSCPVNAFTGGNYDVEICKSHLRTGDVDCWQGCLARRACPANHIPRNPEQSNFHMRAFCPT